MFEINGVNSKATKPKIENLDIRITYPSIHLIMCNDLDMLDVIEGILTNKIKDYEGTIQLDGKEISNIPTEVIGRTEKLINEFTVAQNIFAFNKKHHFLNSGRINNQYLELIRGLNIDIDPGDIVETLGTEQKVLVELLRCFVRSPKLLVLNGPINSLSYKNTALAKEILLAMNQAGVYIVYLTSEMENIFKFGDAISIVLDGTSIDTYDVADIISEPEKLYYAVANATPLLKGAKFDFPKEYSHIYNIIDVGTKYILSNENINNSIINCLQYAENVFEDSQCAFYLFDDSQNKVKQIFSAHMGSNNVPLITEEAIFGIVKDYEYFNCSARDDNFQELFETANNTKTLICFSVRILEQTIGLLQLSFSSFRSITPKNLYYLRIISKELSIVIDNSRLLGRLTILQESHHRIKNNLQLITSILILQKNNLDNVLHSKEDEEVVKELLDNDIARLKTMADVHDMLSKDIGVNGFLDIRSVFEKLREFYSQNINIQMNLNVNFPVMHMRSASVALVINELISNSIKHNKELKMGELTAKISLNQEEEEALIEYRDNGKGYPEGFDIDSSTGIGMTLIKSIVVSELGGELHCYTNNGASVDIRFGIENLQR